jgi:hypothetical protein
LSSPAHPQKAKCNHILCALSPTAIGVVSLFSLSNRTLQQRQAMTILLKEKKDDDDDVLQYLSAQLFSGIAMVSLNTLLARFMISFLISNNNRKQVLQSKAKS